jgi:hypothetical protein
VKKFVQAQDAPMVGKIQGGQSTPLKPIDTSRIQGGKSTPPKLIDTSRIQGGQSTPFKTY